MKAARFMLTPNWYVVKCKLRTRQLTNIISKLLNNVKTR
jgi:hypothetical protein